MKAELPAFRFLILASQVGWLGQAGARVLSVLTPGARSSRLFRALAPELVRALQKACPTFNSHDHGLLVREYRSNPALHSFFEMLSFDEASARQVFVSTMEARDCPFYGTQWHPEKNDFEWSQNADYSNSPHSPDAVLAFETTARFFVSEARKSRHVFPEAQRDELVYSAPVVYTGKGDWTCEQVYVVCSKDAATCGPGARER